MKTIITILLSGILSYSVLAQCGPRPAITAGGPSTFCTGDSVILTASAGDAYLWSTGATTPSIVVKTPADIVVTVTSGGCSTSSDTVFVRNKPFWVSVVCSGNHTMAIKSDGTLWAWGDNNNGQLGTGNSYGAFSPVQVGTDHDWLKVSCGEYHTVAIKTDGTLWSWGNNYYGQLGDGTFTGKMSPVRIGSGHDWISVSCGYFHTIAMKSDQTLWAWGNNVYGQLGDNTNFTRNSPVMIGLGVSCRYFACGGYHSFAVKADSTLWAWGSNGYGQLGNGTTLNQDHPVQLGSNHTWISVSCGKNFTMATDIDGRLWGWGDNSFGQLASFMHYSILHPILVGFMNDWKSISCGSDHVVAVRVDRTVWTWGYNEYGQLGDGTYNISNDTIRQLPGIAGVACAGAGGYYSAIIKDDKSSVCLTGENIYGQLGDGTTGSRSAFGCNAMANPAIVTGEISLILCAGAAVEIPYAVSSDFTQGNVFAAELSDGTGSFAAPVVIGSLASAISGTIMGTVPAGTTAGSGYRIRVVSYCYGITGDDNGTDINVVIPALASITPGGPATFCDGGSVSLSSTAGISYLWNTAATAQTINATLSGNYFVTLTDINGCTAVSDPFAVSVNPLPPVNISVNGPISVCYGTSVTLTAAGASTYEWNNGLGTANVITVTPSVTTSYKVTGTDVFGCSNVASVNIEVNSAITVIAFPPAVCKGQPCTLTASGSTGSYTWNNNLGTGAVKVVAPHDTTTYTVNGSTSNGCPSSASVTIIVHPIPNVKAKASPNKVCEGASVTLSSNGADSYVWSHGLGTGNNKVTYPLVTTNYTVTGTSIYGCSKTASVRVEVKDAPNVTMSVNPSFICAGESSSLTAAGAQSYKWSNGLGNGNHKVVAPGSTICYTVTGTSSNHCTNTAYGTVVVNPKPSVTVTASPTHITTGQTTTLTASGASSYAWSNALGTNNPVTASPLITTSYTVTGTSLVGCSNSAKITITVNGKDLVQDNAARTHGPDSDNVKIGCYPNPFVGKTSVSVGSLQGGPLSVQVYDMAGNVVKTLFEGNIDKNSELTAEFDGSSLPAGIYVCKVTDGCDSFTQKLMLGNQ